MIRVRATREQVHRAYDRFSLFYGALLSPFHGAVSEAVLQRARIGPGDRVLEVAVGPATGLADVCRMTSATATGVDLSLPMLRAARRRLNRLHLKNAWLLQADAGNLPLQGERFDVVLSCHFLDLLPEADIKRALAEARRVLKPGGRLVLANMSKLRPQGRSLWERLYEWLPAGLSADLLGACRPVFAAGMVEESGFIKIRREFVAGAIRSEIVSAEKPVSG